MFEKGVLKPPAVRRGLREAQPTFAPQDSGEFLDQMLFRRALGPMLCKQGRDKRTVLISVFPWQHGVAR